MLYNTTVFNQVLNNIAEMKKCRLNWFDMTTHDLNLDSLDVCDGYAWIVVRQMCKDENETALCACVCACICVHPAYVYLNVLLIIIYYKYVIK